MSYLALKYQRWTSSGCKDIEIINSSLYQRHYSFVINKQCIRKLYINKTHYLIIFFQALHDAGRPLVICDDATCDRVIIIHSINQSINPPYADSIKINHTLSPGDDANCDANTGDLLEDIGQDTGEDTGHKITVFVKYEDQLKEGSVDSEGKSLLFYVDFCL